MSTQPGRTKAIAAVVLVWLLAVGLPVILIRTTNLPTIWTILGCLVAVIVSSAVLPPYIVARATRSWKNDRPRVTCEESWATPLNPSDVAKRIESELQGSARIKRVDASTMEVAVGSDVAFRRWGVFMARGRDALPALVTVSAVADGQGARVSACGRDDLGWYAGPLGKRVEDASLDTIKRLIALIHDASPSAPKVSEPGP